ncbi:1-phosphofructokinase [Dubosiella muris]|uniref:1-phosphofructokinase n=1 Tax=Dubosiella muris TaxID=3038133 RepID=A0AC61RAA3_9FIRM|nr:1-phosphofructokinase [Dubosiella muris]TGY67347.1 1-phosphofructokinase [Dubosiella muris]
MILTVTFNPAIDKTAQVDELIVGGLNRLQNVRQDAGGKGVNVSKTIRALGFESVCTGFLAGAGGRMIEDALDELRIANQFVWVEGNTRTNLKVLNKDMVLTELNEAGPRIEPEDVDALIALIEKTAKPGSIVVLSGNVSPGVESDIYRRMIDDLKQTDIRVLLDADGDLFREGIKAGPFAVKPNRFELAQYFGVEEPDNALDTARLGRKLLNEDTKLVAISMGGEGAIFLTETDTLYCPVLPIELNSSVGAGDAMVAALAISLERGDALEELAVLAMATSAGACTTAGTQPAGLGVVETLKTKVKIENLEG